MNITQDFLGRIDKIWQKPLPEEVRQKACQALLDYIAVTCAGAAFQKEKISELLKLADVGNVRVLGTASDRAMKEAVFLNGLNAHALDFDDGTNSGIIHLGSPVFSVLIPLAQKYGFSIDEVLRAAVIGYETSYTMAISIQPLHKSLGYHATGTCGTLGAALAGAYMMGFSEEDRFQSFAAACIAASGMLKALDDTSELKPYNVAKTALLSLTALQLAKAGFKGPEDPLSGRGFLRMMTRRDDILLEPLLKNGSYAIMKAYTKPYASCRYTHPAVEAAIALRQKIDISSVERIDIKTYNLAVAGHDHTDISGSYSAKMSIPYATAAGLLYGKAGLPEFDEKIVNSPEIQRVIKMVHVEADETMSRNFPQKQTASVDIICGDKNYSLTVDFPKGEPENPMSEQEFRERYDALMEYGRVRSETAAKVYELVRHGNKQIGEIVSLL